MIQVTRLNRIPLVLNSDLIEYIEITPDTVITLTNGHKMVVAESASEVVERVMAFRRSIMSSLLDSPTVRVSAGEQLPEALG